MVHGAEDNSLRTAWHRMKAKGPSAELAQRREARRARHGFQRKLPPRKKEGSGMNSSRLCKVIFLYTTAAALACAVAIAQQPGMSTPQNPGQQAPPGQSPAQPPNPNNTAGPGDNMPGMQGNANQPSMIDQSFVRKTMEDDEAQVQIGQMAQQKSTSDDVKQFGAKMADIHSQLTDQLKPIAKELGVSQPKGPSKKDKEEIARIQTLSGADFDAAVIKALMKYQQTDLKGFKDESETAQDPNVLQVAKMDYPVLSQHLQLLQQIAQAHNVTVESEK
jgi:putative membrane protein